MKYKALIIDGHNFLFRSFFGVPAQVRHADGTQINAVYGFFSLLRAAIGKVSPDYLVVVFDSETSSDVKKLEMPGYKANRGPQDTNIFDQLDLIKKCLDILNVKWTEDSLYEADDVIGYYSRNFIKRAISVFICSNDHDFFQLVREHVFVVRGYRGEQFIFDEVEMLKKYGILPEQYVDYLAIVGDKSDNISGIKGIGPKTAAAILTAYATIDGIMKSLHLLPESLKKKFDGNETQLMYLKKFLKIDCFIELPSEFMLAKYRTSNEPLPDNMGEFLKNHWTQISDR